MKRNVIVYDDYFIREYPYTRLTISSSNTWHCHTFWEFAISLSGEYKNEIEGETFILQEGNCILLRPEDVHNCRCFKNGHLHRDIYVSDGIMKRVCGVFGDDLYKKLKDNPHVLNYYLSKSELEVVKKDLEYLELNQKKPEFMPEVFLCVILTNIIGLWIKKNMVGENLPKEIFELVTRINSGMYLQSTVDEIVASANYSHGYLCKLFKKHVGVSILEYVRDFKLSYAMFLLSDESLRIIDISNKLNYDVPSSFVNAFKRKYGMSPNAMRKKMLNERT